MGITQFALYWSSWQGLFCWWHTWVCSLSTCFSFLGISTDIFILFFFFTCNLVYFMYQICSCKFCFRQYPTIHFAKAVFFTGHTNSYCYHILILTVITGTVLWTSTILGMARGMTGGCYYRILKWGGCIWQLLCLKTVKRYIFHLFFLFDSTEGK